MEEKSLGSALLLILIGARSDEANAGVVSQMRAGSIGTRTLAVLHRLLRSRGGKTHFGARQLFPSRPPPVCLREEMRQLTKLALVITLE